MLVTNPDVAAATARDETRMSKLGYMKFTWVKQKYVGVGFGKSGNDQEE
jgi:hypothetical protein